MIYGAKMAQIVKDRKIYLMKNFKTANNFISLYRSKLAMEIVVL